MIPQIGYLYREGGIAAPDGHCRTFDVEARGTVPGNGVGIVVLKRLEDALAERDMIRAVIKGSAMNNDGSGKVGFTAPSIDGQAAVIIESQSLAGIHPDTISYIEAHGTGTPLGDPIEVQALTQAFRTAGSIGTGFCALGSLKTNIGHLDAAAGVAGLIKTVLALQHRQLPPSLHFHQANPACQLEKSPFYVNTHLRSWPIDNKSGVRRAGVSSFGMGGTNVHILLEEAPPRPLRSASRSGPHLLLLSAKTPTDLEQMTASFTRYMAAKPGLELADVAATLQLGRGLFRHRRFLVAQDSQEIQDAWLANPALWISGEQHQQDRPVAFLFPGQGNLFVGRGAQLYQAEPVFRQTFNRCAEILRPYLDLDIRTLLSPPAERKAQIEALLQETAYAQPLQFVLSYALAQLWQQRGVRPQVMLGHSLGEYAAACLAGVFSLEDALRLIACRGALMQKMSAGAMLSVALSAEATMERLIPGLEIAALNGEELTVVSGPSALVEDWHQQLGREKIVCQPLRVTRAFHSALLDPMLPTFLQEVRQVKLHEPRIPYISNLSGTWITASQATDPAYWGEQLRQPVQFLRGLQTLQEVTLGALLEVGPGTSLTGLARRYQQRTQSTKHPALVASMSHPKDLRHECVVLLEAVGHLWLAGVPLKWDKLTDAQWQRVCLPLYPFERRSFWYKSGISHSQGAVQTPPDQPSLLSSLDPASAQPSPEIEQTEISYTSQIEEIIASIWSDLIGVSPIERDADFFALGGDSMVASLVVARFTERFGVRFPLRLLFEQPTVSALASAVEEMLLEQLATLEQETQ